jgi:hypothetical protein
MLHVVRQRSESRLPRHSKETPRTMSPMRMSTSGRYNAENMVAYQLGNAAKMPAPATMSQTSLASQNGPIVLIATRRSVSLFPTNQCRMPTPKSKPSSTKKPHQSTAMTRNQKICKPMSRS